MIRSFLPLLLLLLATPLAAQITLTSENLIAPDDGDFTVSYAFPVSDVGLPAEGEDLIWDYSNLVFTDTSMVRRFSVEPNPDFPEATFSSAGLGTAVNFFPIIVTNYETIGEDAWRSVGVTLSGGDYSITALTGGVTDSFHIPDASQSFNRVLIPFPFSYGSRLEDTYGESYNYEISVAGFGLNRAPVTIRDSTEISREAVGWGQLLMPTGPDELIETYDVLLVKRISVRTDSIFLFGQPAPPQLIAAFGATQGQVIRDTAYFFYSPLEFATALASFNDGQAFFRPLPRLTTSVRNPDLSPSTVYPNPAVAGNRLVFDFPPVLPGDCLLQLIGMDGRLVHEETLSPDPSDRAQITVPATLTTGPYFYVIRSPGGQPLTSGKIQLR